MCDNLPHPIRLLETCKDLQENLQILKNSAN